MNNNKSILAIIALLVIIVFLGWFFSDILIYMLFALAIAFIGKPIMRLFSKITRKGKPIIPRSVAAAFTIILIFGVIFLIGYFLLPLLIRELQFVTNIDPMKASDNFTNWVNQLDPFLRKFGLLQGNEHFSDILAMEVQKFSHKIDMSNIVSNTFSTVKDLVIGLFAIVFMSFFALKDHGIFFRMISEWIPKNYRGNFSNILNATGKQLTSYFTGVLIDMICVGLIEFLICLIFQVPNALLIGGIGAILNILPYVGPVIGCIIGIIISLTSLIPTDPGSALLLNTIIKVIAAFVTANLVENFILQPTIYSKRTKTHPLEIFVVILMAGYLGGIFAMIFAVPAYTTLRIVVKEFFGNYFFSDEDEEPTDEVPLIPEETPQTPPPNQQNE